MSSEERNSKSVLEEFRSSATIHGISRIGGSSLYSFRWIVWVFLVCGMASALGTFVFMEMWRYSENPTLTKIKANFRDVMEFPAVTICNLNQVKSSIQNCTDKDFVTEFFYKTSEASAIRNKLLYTGSKEASLTGEEIFECVRKHSHQLSDMFDVCVWGGKRVNCSDIFHPQITAYGLCYTFNGNKSTPVLVKNGQGSGYGLRVYVNIEQDNYFFAKSIQAGIKVVLHDPTEEPLPQWRGFLVGPGLSASAVVTRQKKTYLPAPYGSCVDTKRADFVNPLKRADKYTRLACDQDCLSNELTERCKCRYFYYPGSERLCNGDELLDCILPNLYELLAENSAYRRCANSCRKACEEITYDSSLSYALFSSTFVNNYFYSEGLLPDKSTIKENYIDLRIYYDSLLDVEIEEVPETTIPKIFGTLGGNMGLFLGASMLSLVELIEFCVLYCMRSKTSKYVTKPSETDNKENDNNMNIGK